MGPLLAPWDPNYEAKAGPQLVWVSRVYLWPQPPSEAREEAE